jgi:hypothetical protein
MINLNKYNEYKISKSTCLGANIWKYNLNNEKNAKKHKAINPSLLHQTI